MDELPAHEKSAVVGTDRFVCARDGMDWPCTAAMAAGVMDPRAMRDHLLRILHQIDRYGVSIQGVFDPEGDDPSFAYTVGLYRVAKAEAIIVGLPMEISQMILNTLYAKAKHGLVLEHGRVLHGFLANDVPLMLIEVLDRGPFGMNTADRIMLDDGGQVPVFQVVWPRQDGTWSPDLAQQPLLGVLPPDAG